MDSGSVLQNCLLSNFHNLISVRLDDSNYVTWKFLVETMFAGCGLMKYIDGSFPCPPQDLIIEGGIRSDMTKEYKDWVQNDSAVMSILAATLSSDALSFIIGSKSSKEIWCRLKEKYVDDSRYNIMVLKNSLYKIKKGSDSIDKYLFRVKSICDQLATMGVYMDAEEIVISVVNGLPSEFTTIKTIIRIKALSSSVSMKDLRSLLLIAEDEIGQSVKSMSLSLETAMAAFADKSRASVSQIEHVPASSTTTANTGFVNSFIVAPIGIDSPMQAPDHSPMQAPIGSPHSNHISQAASYVKASSDCHSAYIANTMNSNGSHSPTTDFVPQMQSDGHVLHPSPTPTQAFCPTSPGSISFHPQANGISLRNRSFLGRKNRSSNIVCHFCGNRGHYAYNCYRRNFQPLDTASSSCIKCQICYCLGHVARTCPQRPAARKTVSSGASLNCQICLRSGHSAAECFHRHHYVLHLPTSAKSHSVAAFSSPQSMSPAFDAQSNLCSSLPPGVSSLLLPPFSPGYSN